jgi:hypothetical protein
MKLTIKYFLSVIITIYLIILTIAYFTQEKIVYSPPDILREPQDIKIIYYNVNNAAIKTYLSKGTSSEAIIYLGAHNENIAIKIKTLKAAFPNKSLYLINYRGYANSTGIPSETAIYSDVGEIYKIISSKSSNVTIVGNEMGANIAVKIAHDFPVKNIILISPSDSISNAIYDHIPILPISILFRDKFNAMRFAPLVRAKTKVIAYEKGGYISIERSKNIYKKFAPGIANITLISSYNTESGFDQELINALQSR